MSAPSEAGDACTVTDADAEADRAWYTVVGELRCKTAEVVVANHVINPSRWSTMIAVLKTRPLGQTTRGIFLQDCVFADMPVGFLSELARIPAVKGIRVASNDVRRREHGDQQLEELDYISHLMMTLATERTQIETLSLRPRGIPLSRMLALATRMVCGRHLSLYSLEIYGRYRVPVARAVERLIAAAHCRRTTGNLRIACVDKYAAWVRTDEWIRRDLCDIEEMLRRPRFSNQHVAVISAGQYFNDKLYHMQPPTWRRYDTAHRIWAARRKLADGEQEPLESVACLQIDADAFAGNMEAICEYAVQKAPHAECLVIDARGNTK
jgi:hypothetical protein